jgi:Winged helix DNA-binding domain
MSGPAISLAPQRSPAVTHAQPVVGRTHWQSAHQMVTWFGAMQAQDLGSGEWSFGVRNPALTQADIAAATENRELLRTWPMRGTVHFVPPVGAQSPSARARRRPGGASHPVLSQPWSGQCQGLRWLDGLDHGRCASGVAGDSLMAIDLDGLDLLTCADALDSPAPMSGILLLPGFDEYLLGIKDRSLMLGEGDFKRIVPGGNGIFKPTIVADGRVIGTWQGTVKRDRVDIKATPFGAFTTQDREGITAAAAGYGAYLGLSARITT